MRLRHLTASILGLCMAALSACERVEQVLRAAAPAPAVPHEAYLASLGEAGLGNTALAARWREAAERALGSPVRLETPFEEIAFYPSEEPTAASYAVSIERGQSVDISFETEPADAGGVFVDVFRIEPDGPPSHVAYAREGERRLEFEPSRAGEFVVRVQPELLRDVRVRLRVVNAAVLAFPVLGHDVGSIQSRFGVARDGGRRAHHGVDIFAPRGTPVLAASDGVVRRVGDQRLGGRIVWLRDERRGTNQYYAHLDSQLVVRGQRVRAGDTLGLVGNTGNARTTPPHLHFGLYVRRGGPIDPWDHLRMPTQDPGRLVADSTLLGRWVRTGRGPIIAASASAGEVTLEPHTVVRVLGASGRDLRAELPDGRSILLRGRLETLDTPIDEAVVAAGSPIFSAPRLGAVPAASHDRPGSLPVVGRFADYLLVRPTSGPQAWIEIPR